jgi:hypothetical protein
MDQQLDLDLRSECDRTDAEAFGGPISELGANNLGSLEPPLVDQKYLWLSVRVES